MKWYSRDFPGGPVVTTLHFQCRGPEFAPWVGKIPWRRKWQLTPVFLPGISHGQRILVGYSPRGRKESDKTEQQKHWRRRTHQKLWNTHILWHKHPRLSLQLHWVTCMPCNAWKTKTSLSQHSFPVCSPVLEDTVVSIVFTHSTSQAWLTPFTG